MSKNTSVVLGDHFEDFISAQVKQGRYGSASEVIRQGLRLLQDYEQKMEALRQAIAEGKNRGPAVSYDMASIKRKARRKANMNA